MDKNAIKKFAVWARTELIARVSLKGVEYGITEESEQWSVSGEQWSADSANGKVFSVMEKKQRQALITEIIDKGYMDLCQYFEHKKLKGYADFFNSSSSFCCGVI